MGDRGRRASFEEYMQSEGLPLGQAMQQQQQEGAVSAVEASAVLPRRSTSGLVSASGASMLQSYSPPTPAAPGPAPLPRPPTPGSDPAAALAWRPGSAARPPLPPGAPHSAPPADHSPAPARRAPEPPSPGDDELRRELAQLRQKLAMKDAMLAEQEQELHDAEEQAAQTRAELQQTRTDLQRARVELQQARLQRAPDPSPPAGLREAEAERDALREQVAQLTAAVQQLEAERHQSAELTMQAGELLKKVQGDNDRAARAILDSLRALPQTEDEAPGGDDVGHLVEHAVRVWERELRAAEEEARALRQQSRSGDHRRLEAELEDARRSERELREELRQARKELEQSAAPEREAAADALRRAREAEAECRRLSSELAESRAAQAGADGGAAELTRLREAYDQGERELRGQVAALREQLQQRERQCEELGARTQEQGEELAQARGALRRAEQAAAEALEDRDALEQQLRRAKGEGGGLPAAPRVSPPRAAQPRSLAGGRVTYQPPPQSAEDRSDGGTCSTSPLFHSPLRSGSRRAPGEALPAASPYERDTSTHPEVIQGELEKLGSGRVPKKWKRRFFVADRECLQYFERREDYEIALQRSEPIFKGVRFFRHQLAFVSAFSDRPRSRAPAGGGLPDDVCYHPKATDPKYYYFGFVPKKDNTLTCQLPAHERKFLLRTESRQVWLEWCRFLSRQFNPELWRQSFPELNPPQHETGTQTRLGDVGDLAAPGVPTVVTAALPSPTRERPPVPEAPTPPRRAPPSPADEMLWERPAAATSHGQSPAKRQTQTQTGAPPPAVPRQTQTGTAGDSFDRDSELKSLRQARAILSEELRKSEEGMRRVLDEQEPLRARGEAAESECVELREALRGRDREVSRQADSLRAREAELDELRAELRRLQAQMAAQGEGILVAQGEADRLRDQLQQARRDELSSAAAAPPPPVATPTRSAPPPPRSPSGAPSAAVQTSPSVPDMAELTRRVEEAREVEQHITHVKRAAKQQLRDQEKHHDQQISLFCDQVLRDMEAIREHSQKELQRRDQEWQKELQIWQQLVAEKEQQIVAAGRRASARGDDEQELDEVRNEQWRVIGGGARRDSPVVLALKLSQTDDFGSYGTRVAVDRRSLAQVSVVDDPAGQDARSMHRTWRFMSLGGDQTTVVLTLAILPPPCASPQRGSARDRALRSTEERGTPPSHRAPRRQQPRRHTTGTPRRGPPQQMALYP